MHAFWENYKYYSDKRYSTIAGTLVYFLLMSIAPFTLWLTLAFGNVQIGQQFLDNDLFAGVSPFLRYLKESAESAASGAGMVLLITSLYSSANFFYHLRRSGEIVYDSPRVKGGLKLRLLSMALILAVLFSLAAIAGVVFVGTQFLSSFLPDWASQGLSCVFLTAAAFGVAMLLNLFACPYKIKAREALSGSLLTTALWLIFSVGFRIYMIFARPERLYGKLAFLILFLLWCYIMACCFVVGMIHNGMYKTNRRPKKLL